ncbi:hypothetical protein Y032_0009g746 [Ancylostoma ceylanicum]|uniref:SGNH domain-containing protein n=1 Tax=Ancylostoma ceylanicum TaxID=53326 RepID=A0A016VKB3_9BILA|nr:hypothetical protein Y032_0009g746 [Ancylostoma ceylanicum]
MVRLYGVIGTKQFLAKWSANEEELGSARAMCKKLALRVRMKDYYGPENGTGPYNILVIGNSFACNQAELVYNAFKKHSRHFSVFCLAGCEVLTRAVYRCWKPDFNYSTILHELKPDIVFVLVRAMASKRIVNNKRPIVEDKIFKNYVKRMAEMETIAKKIYVLQALPTCRKGCLRHAMAFTNDGRFLRDIKEALIKRDDFFARLRINEIGKRCKKCEIIDYKPVLVDDHGHYLGYDPKTNLMFLDGINHFNRFGKERIQTVYNRLAKEFELSRSHI